MAKKENTLVGIDFIDNGTPEIKEAFLGGRIYQTGVVIGRLERLADDRILSGASEPGSPEIVMLNSVLDYLRGKWND